MYDLGSTELECGFKLKYVHEFEFKTAAMDESTLAILRTHTDHKYSLFLFLYDLETGMLIQRYQIGCMGSLYYNPPCQMQMHAGKIVFVQGGQIFVCHFDKIHRPRTVKVLKLGSEHTVPKEPKKFNLHTEEVEVDISSLHSMVASIMQCELENLAEVLIYSSELRADKSSMVNQYERYYIMVNQMNEAFKEEQLSKSNPLASDLLYRNRREAPFLAPVQIWRKKTTLPNNASESEHAEVFLFKMCKKISWNEGKTKTEGQWKYSDMTDTDVEVLIKQL